MTATDELKELQDENFRLRAMLARAGVTVPPSAELPNEEELDKLIAMVEAAHPRLKCPDGSKEFIAANKTEVFNAIHFLCFAFRTEKLATQRSPAFWFDALREWAANRGYANVKVNLRPFTVAAIASRVAYSPIDNYPYLSFGLSLGGVGQPSTAWRDTLRTRTLVPPTETQISHKVRDHNWA